MYWEIEVILRLFNFSYSVAYLM